MERKNTMSRRDRGRKPSSRRKSPAPAPAATGRLVTSHCAFCVDKLLRVRSMDDNLLAILDKEPSQVLGIPYYELLPRIEVGGTDAVEDVIRHVGARIVKEFRLFTFARRVLAADIYIYVLVNTAGEISGALVIAKALPHSDISREYYRAQQSIDMGMFAATLAHGVRNPLNAIKGAVFYLKKRYAKEKTVVDLTAMAEEEIAGLEDFITRFLSTSTAGATFVESDIFTVLRKTGDRVPLEVADRICGRSGRTRGSSPAHGTAPYSCSPAECRQPQETINLGKIVATLACGVRNPLIAIKGAFFYLKKKYAGDSTIADFARMAEEEIARLDDFITNFLNTSTWTPNPLESDLNEIVRRLEAFVRFQAGASNIHCLYDYGDVPHVLINMLEMQQAILNILNNSIEAMPSGGDISVRTLCEAIDGKEFVVVEVSDTGKGLSRKEFDRLLAVPDYGRGRGFGLFITRYLMRRHGGDLRISSERGAGTTVRLLLPAVAGSGRVPQRADRIQR